MERIMNMRTDSVDAEHQAMRDKQPGHQFYLIFTEATDKWDDADIEGAVKRGGTTSPIPWRYVHIPRENPSRSRGNCRERAVPQGRLSQLYDQAVANE